ncbi:signal recognition particle, SRP14 subunit, partial [Talaromyces proteolyticus]
MTAHMSNEEFFTSLTSLLSTTSQKSRGSVYLIQKRLSPDDTDPTIAPGSILVRATDGRTQNADKSRPDGNKPGVKKRTESGPKVKLSTIVAPVDLESFFVKYADVC